MVSRRRGSHRKGSTCQKKTAPLAAAAAAAAPKAKKEEEEKLINFRAKIGESRDNGVSPEA